MTQRRRGYAEFFGKDSHVEEKPNPYIFDICCGTGAVITAFANQYSESVPVGCDFSQGMLLKVREKPEPSS
jgi:ubiquinone/menaquinone biosynthesis C-methylase UbiE